MRGRDDRAEGMFSYIRLEERVPADHPLRAIRRLADEALAALNGRLDAVYSGMGRPSIPPEMLLRATLLQAFFSVRSERQLMEQIAGNAGAVVRYADDDRPVRDLDADRDRRVRCLTNGVERVLQKVDEDLLEADSAGGHRRIVCPRRSVYGDAGIADASAEQRQRAVDGLLDRDRPEVAGAAPGEPAQRLGDRADALGDRDDLAKIAARLASLAGVEQPAAGFGIGTDRRQRLVDLMRDPGGHLAEDRQAVRLGEVLPQPSRADLRRLAFGDFRGQRRVGPVELIGAQRDPALELAIYRGERLLPCERPSPAPQ